MVGVVVAAIVLVTVGVVVAFVLPPSGVTFQSSWTDNTLFGSGMLHYEGTVFNHYNSTIHSVRLELQLFDSYGHIIKTETIDVGEIPALGSKPVSVDIEHSSLLGVNEVKQFLVWNP